MFFRGLDPYGNTLSISGPRAEVNRYRFSSKEWHARSGFIYYGYRWYVPELQRWANRDPLEERGGLNLYTFADNAAIYFIDSDGRFVGQGLIMGFIHRLISQLNYECECWALQRNVEG